MKFNSFYCPAYVREYFSLKSYLIKLIWLYSLPYLKKLLLLSVMEKKRYMLLGDQPKNKHSTEIVL